MLPRDRLVRLHTTWWSVLVALLALGCGEDSQAPGAAAAGSGGSSGGSGGASGGSGGASGGTSGAGGSAGKASGGAAGSGGSTAGTGGSGATATGCLFPDGFYFCEDVSALPPSPESEAILAALGEWGNSNNFDITFDFDIFEATDATPTVTIDPGYADESDIRPVPVVPGGVLEGESSYVCEGGGDCHYLVIQIDEGLLYELYAANQVTTTQWDAMEVAIWDLSRVYSPTANRGMSCTSADAAGFPITQGLIRVEEVVTVGRIDHALRFILPNSSMRANALVPPATHIGGPSSDDPNAPPYGIRLRLKESFDESSIPSEGGRVVVRALKQYGMLLSDGGNIALTAERDDFTTAKWDGVLESHDLRGIQVSDFDVVDFGPVEEYDSLPDCVLDNPLPP